MAMKPVILFQINAKEVITPLPECKRHKWDSDAYWECYVRHVTLNMYHPACTARIGAPAQGDEPAQGVVDAQLRVHGVRQLRVADASIMPIVVSGNTNAACIMIGEKAADLIRGKGAA